MDKVRESSLDAQVEQTKKGFREQMMTLAKLEKFRMKEFRDMMVAAAAQQGATGWRSYIPSMRNQPEEEEQLEELKQQTKIMEHFSDATLRIKDSIQVDRLEKQRVAEAAGVTVVEVNALLRHFDGNVSLHAYLKDRQVKNLSLPTSQAELFGLMKTEKAKMTPADKRRYRAHRKKRR